MTTITWSAPEGDWKSLCVNELRLEAVPDEVRLDNCKVCVAPQIIEREPVTGCFSCRDMPPRLNLYLDQPLGSGPREIREQFQISYPTVSLVDNVTGTWTTTHTKTWYMHPVPGDRVFSLQPLLPAWGSTLPPNDNRCYWVWGDSSFEWRYTLPARGAPTQNVTWHRPVTGLFQEQFRWPSGPTTVGPDLSLANWNLTGREGAGVRFATPLTGLVPQAYPLTEWTSPSLDNHTEQTDRPEVAAARAAIDAANLTFPDTIRLEGRITGHAWLLAVGDGWNPLFPDLRWRASRKFTLTLYGRCVAGAVAAVSPGVGGYLSGSWVLQPSQIDMTGIRPNTWPRDPFVPFRNPRDNWRNPVFPETYQTANIPPQLIDLPMKYGAPSSLMTVHEEVKYPPGIERGVPRELLSDVIDFDFLPHRTVVSHPFVGKDRPPTEFPESGYPSIGVELGRWVGQPTCEQNSPIQLTGGPTYPHRYGGPMNIPSQVYLDIGNPP